MNIPISISLLVADRMTLLASQVEELQAVEKNLCSALNSCKLAVESIQQDRKLLIEWAQKYLTEDEMTRLDIAPIPF